MLLRTFETHSLTNMQKQYLRIRKIPYYKSEFFIVLNHVIGDTDIPLEDDPIDTFWKFVNNDSNSLIGLESYLSFCLHHQQNSYIHNEDTNNSEIATKFKELMEHLKFVEDELLTNEPKNITPSKISPILSTSNWVDSPLESLSHKYDFSLYLYTKFEKILLQKGECKKRRNIKLWFI